MSITFNPELSISAFWESLINKDVLQKLPDCFKTALADFIQVLQDHFAVFCKQIFELRRENEKFCVEMSKLIKQVSVLESQKSDDTTVVFSYAKSLKKPLWLL